MKKVLMLVLVSCLAVLMIVPACAPPVEPVEPVKVGVCVHFGFLYGDHLRKGTTMAADEINQAGGVLGRPIELVEIHSNELASPTDAVAALEKLITVDKVDLVFLGARTESVLAQQDVACDHKVININGGGADLLMNEKIVEDYDRYKYYFHMLNQAYYIGDSVASHTAQVADQMKEELGIETIKIALVAEKLMWTKISVGEFLEVLPDMLTGYEIVGEWWPSSLATDLTAELTAIKAEEPHIIVGWLTGPASAPFIKQWDALKIPAALTGLYAAMGDWKIYSEVFNIDYPVIIDPAGIMTDTEITPKSTPFHDEYVERWGVLPIYTSCIGYDGLHIWRDAVERAGTFDSDAVVAELEKTDYVGTYGRIVFWGRDDKWPHDGKWGKDYTTYTYVQAQDGELKHFWPTKDYPEEWGIEYKNTVPYQIPPWVVEYWQGK